MMAQAGASFDTENPWDTIDWTSMEANVRRLQTRIVKAVQEQRWNKVRALQHLLTRSRSGKFLAVNRVTENRGKRTPGIDRVIWDTPSKKLAGVASMKQRGYRPLALRRIYIPKSNGKLRPLGIPSIRDRAMQALYLLALDPVAETLGDCASYGFRQGRGCADAIERCFCALSHQNPSWVLEGDIQGCFDNIDHQWLLDHALTDKVILQKWLKSGFLENQVFFDTVSGTPQGGIISPVLANIALDGLERKLREAFPLAGLGSWRGKAAQVHLVRYADDFIITANTREILEERVKPLVETFLAARGLTLSPEKTHITHIIEGFDFLGQNIRRYPNGKLYIKPAKKSIRSLLTRISDIVKSMWSAPASALIARLNPVIRGWANYHRHVVAKCIFAYVDHRIFHILWTWAKARHPKKGLRWIKRKYYARFGHRDWWFSAPNPVERSRPPYRLLHAKSVRIVRHIQVRSGLNPYDPSWDAYMKQRSTRANVRAASG